MTKINTAERVSAEASDNFVFQRSLLAYHAAAERIAGDVLEIGTGSGYGIEVVAPRARRFVTVDKHVPAPKLLQLPNVEFRQAEVPPLDFPDGSFDCVISFQVIEHIRRDGDFVREIARVLRPGGRFIVTTPQRADVADTQSVARARIHGRRTPEAPRREFFPRSRPSGCSEMKK